MTDSTDIEITDGTDVVRLRALVTELDRLLAPDLPALAVVDPDGNPGHVTAGELIESAWGNAVVDRVVKRYANKAAIDAVVSPANGTIALAVDTGWLWLRKAGVWQPPPGHLIYSNDVLGTAAQPLAVGNNALAGINSPTFPYPTLVRASYDVGFRNSVAPLIAATLGIFQQSTGAAVGPVASAQAVVVGLYLPVSASASWVVAAGGNTGSYAQLGVGAGFGGAATAVSRGTVQIYAN
jgi:hypothetical protein